MLPGTCLRAKVRCSLCALSGFAAHGGRCCLAPVRVPWLWPAPCYSGVPRGPAWCAAPRPVRSLSCSGRLSGRRGASPHPGDFRPRDLLGGCAGHAEAGREPGALCLPLAPAKARALGLLRVVSVLGPAMGLSLVGPSGVGLGLRACGGLRVWTRSLTRLVSRTPHLSTKDSAGALGLFRVDADTFCFSQEDATTGSGACVRVRALLGRVGRAGLPGAFWCISPFRWPLCPSALLGPLRDGIAPFLSFCLPSVCFFLPSPCAPAVSGFLWVPAPGVMGLGAPCPPPRPPLSLFFLLSFSLRRRCVWLSLVSGFGCPGSWPSLPPPPPRPPLFLFLLFRVSSPGPLGLVFVSFRPAWFGVRFLPTCLVWCLFPSGLLFLFPPPLPFSFFFGFFCLSRSPCLFCGYPTARLPVCSSFFFVCCAVLLGCGMLCRVLGRDVVLRCSRCGVLFCFGLRCRVLYGAVPQGAVLRHVAARRSARRCPVLCRVVFCRLFGAVDCCVVPLGAVRRLVVLRFPAPCFVVLPRVVCSVLCLSFRGVLVHAVVRRCALCCVCVCALCVLGCRAAHSLSSPLCAVLRCLVPGAVVRCCVLCRVLWCFVVWCWVWLPTVVLWWRVSVSVSLCRRVACFPVVGVVCCGALLPCVVFCGAVLWCFAVLSCSAVFWRCCLCSLSLLLCPVALCCLVVPCCWIVLCVVLCCVCLSFFQIPLQRTKLKKWFFSEKKLYTTQRTHAGMLCAVLSAVPFSWALCGALVRCAVWRAVLLCPPVACRSAPCCAVLCCWLSLLFFARWWPLCAVVPLSSLPACTRHIDCLPVLPCARLCVSVSCR